MVTNFYTIGIVGHLQDSDAIFFHKNLYFWLKQQGYNVILEKKIASNFKSDEVLIGTLNYIGQQADLAIVVGGDGNMLSAARILSKYNIKVIGINRGNLGFLTDLDPDSALQKLSNVLLGYYHDDKRFLLEAKIYKNNVCNRISYAINEVILHSCKVAHMIEFEVYIDDIFSFSQRADGLIVATPTGSTAYSLSAGGPIITPLVNAIVLIPIFPHTLSSRPLVINGNSTIRLKFAKPIFDIDISCDSQVTLSINDGEEIFIHRSNFCINLIHPNDYDYFNVLSNKLGWLKKSC